MNTEKERIAIYRIRAFEPPEGYCVAYSGGKDSDCIKILAALSGVKFEAIHNLTTVDAPETMQYIKSQPDVKIEKARWPDGRHKTMWNLIVHKGTPPTRLMRYCCSELKERQGRGRFHIIGVRWAESAKRRNNAAVVKIIGKPKTVQKAAEDVGADYHITRQGGLIMNNDNDENRRLVEHCYRTTKTLLSPIVDWTESDVWEFLHHYGCEANPLYQCGFSRVGCIGCPVAARHQAAEFERYPAYKAAYIHAFDRMQKRRLEQGKPPFGNDFSECMNGEEIFNWWIGGKSWKK